MLCCTSSSNSARRSSICFSCFVDGRERAARFGFIVVLLAHWNHLRRIADLDAKRAAGCCDAEVLVAEATDEVEWFLRDLFLGQAKRVCFDLRLDGRADLWRRAKETICGHQAIDALMRTLEVVVLHEELDATKTVREVCEHG